MREVLVSRKGSSTRRSPPAWSCRSICRRTSRCGAPTRSRRSCRSIRPRRGSTPCRGSPGVYTVKFSRLGENMLTVKYGNGQWTTLEFFVTEPLETVIQKRAAFLVSHHQHTDPSKWYVGMYSDWDQKNEIRRSPEDRDSLSAWLTDANDDAGNARPAFIASKNVFLPEQKEIDSLELYIGKYLWGGMQMTDKEKYPYAIYGIPNWKANRASADEGRNGQAHVWRIYDYPHIVMLYFRMYQIAKFYPDEGEASSTRPATSSAPIARRLPTGPCRTRSRNGRPTRSGTMNEAFIPELIDALEREGQGGVGAGRCAGTGKGRSIASSTGRRTSTARSSRSTRPASSRPAPSRATPTRTRMRDRHARRGEEVHRLPAVAEHGGSRLARDHLLPAGQRLSRLADLSPQLHVADGRLGDPRLRAAFRGRSDRLSAPRLRLVAQLVGAGEFRARRRAATAYWFPSANNDGAAGGGFMPEPLGRAWIGKQMTRGAWYLQRRGRRQLLRRDPDARHDRHARSGARRDRVRRAADARRLDREGHPARRPARPLPRRSAATSGSTWSWITTASRRSSRSSSATTCRGSSSRSRTAPAARTDRSVDCGSAGGGV